ncbi:MAG TPA: tagaturonate reductase [Epulopiscium sp.]|nr:tagaturonate reductase [Candidatus Epulonipiscium sp.]
MKNIAQVCEKTIYPEKIIQFGEGNFLRAFVNWITDTMNKKELFNGSSVVVQPIKHGMVKELNAQNGLYTLYLRGIKDKQAVSEHIVIESISRAINPYENLNDYQALAINPESRFVISNTTEAGIAVNPEDKLEDTPPSSFPAKVTAMLYKRYTHFNADTSKGFIFLPCELIDKNGEKLKESILEYIKLWKLDDKFKAWVCEHSIFCNTLVDRIVPGYPRDRMEEINQELGYEDNLVVEAEQFHLWVIEGPDSVKEEFPADQAGLNVLFVNDLTPYRTQKVRVLNGAHTTLVPVAYLYGIDTVRESVEHPVIGRWIKEAIFDEIAPVLPLPLESVKQFADDVIDRFTNPFVKHYLMSISLNSMSKYETRVLPTLLEYNEQKNTLPDKLVFSLAALMAFYKGYRGTTAIELQDDKDILDLYKDVWADYDQGKIELQEVVERVLAYKKNWKMDLNEIKGLKEKVTDYLALILEKGMENAIAEMM